MRVKFFFVFILTVIILLSGCSVLSEQPVKIAFIGPLSGPNQAVGIGARNSFELKVNEVLEEGNYPYQLEVVYLDDASDIDTGVAVVQQTCGDSQIVATAPHWNSPVALATVKQFNDCGLMEVLWGTVHRDIIYTNDYLTKVRILPTSIQFNEMGAEYAVGQFKRLRWTIVSDSTDLGTTLEKEFEQSVEWRGGNVFSKLIIDVGQKDFSEVVNKIAGLQPDGVYFGGLVTEGALLRKQMVESGLGDVMFIGPAGIQSESFAEIAGETAEGAFCAGTFDPTQTPEGRSFIQAYEAIYTESYEQNGAYAYDAAGIILEAIQAVGPKRASIVEYIRSHDFDGITGTIQWDTYGQNTSGGLIFYVNQDGNWIRFEDSEYASGVRPLPWEE